MREPTECGWKLKGTGFWRWLERAAGPTLGEEGHGTRMHLQL